MDFEEWWKKEVKEEALSEWSMGRFAEFCFNGGKTAQELNKGIIAMSDNLESLIFIALGEASMCWSDIDKAGVFDSSQCKEIGHRLISAINGVLKPQTIDNSTTNKLCPKCGSEAYYIQTCTNKKCSRYDWG